MVDKKTLFFDPSQPILLGGHSQICDEIVATCKGALAINMQITLGDIVLEIMRKDIKKYLSELFPPEGRAMVSALRRIEMDKVRAFVTTKLDWMGGIRISLECGYRRLSGNAEKAKGF